MKKPRFLTYRPSQKRQMKYKYLLASIKILNEFLKIETKEDKAEGAIDSMKFKLNTVRNG